MRRTFALVLLGLLLLGSGAAMAQANMHDASGTFTDFLDMVRQSANMWSGRLRGYAIKLFWTLALIQFVWTFGMMIFRQADLGELLAEFVRFIMIIGFFSALLIYSVDWAEGIINSFRQAGASAAGLGTGLRPGDMFAFAVSTAKLIQDTAGWDPLMALPGALCALVILLCFGFIAAFMLVTLIQSYVVINAAVFFIGFGGSQWTREYALSMVRYSISVGAKLFVLTLIVGLVMIATRQWQEGYRMQPDEASMWTLAGVAFVACYLCKVIPENVQDLIQGVSLGGGSALGGMAAAGMAGVATGAAMVASKMASANLMGGTGNSIVDSIKSSLSGGSGGGSSMGMNSGSGGAPGPAPKARGPIGAGVPPSPSGSGSSGASASSGKASGGSASSAGSSSASGSSSPATMAHAAAAMGIKTLGTATSIAMPGAEGAADASIGPPPTPPGDLGISETPENIIRPAPEGAVPTEQAASESQSVDTMSSLQEALNNRGKPA